VPAYGFALVMILISVGLMAWGIARLRVWNPSGEPIMQRELPETKRKRIGSKRTLLRNRPGGLGQSHSLARNPHARIRTHAALGQVRLFSGACFSLLLRDRTLVEQRRRGPICRRWGLLPVSILSLLLVGAQAVTAITSERDIRALDLLLVTDLSPKEFIFGKLWASFITRKNTCCLL